MNADDARPPAGCPERFLLGDLDMKTLAASLLLALFASAPAFAQEQVAARMAIKYDLDSDSYTYCRLEGQGDRVDGPGLVGPAAILTSGSSTTVSEATASTNPFTNVAVGDVIIVDGNVVAVTARASAASITVDTAINLTAGKTFQYFKHACGTAATDGWVTVGPTDSVILGFELNQEDTTSGVDVRWECKAAVPSAQPVQVYPDNSAGAATKTYTAAGIDARTWVNIDVAVSACRIGFKVTSTDDGTDTGAARESINAYALIRRAIN